MAITKNVVKGGHSAPVLRNLPTGTKIKIETPAPAIKAGWGACSACSCRGYKPKDGCCANCGHHHSLHA